MSSRPKKKSGRRGVGRGRQLLAQDVHLPGASHHESEDEDGVDMVPGTEQKRMIQLRQHLKETERRRQALVKSENVRPLPRPADGGETSASRQFHRQFGTGKSKMSKFKRPNSNSRAIRPEKHYAYCFLSYRWNTGSTLAWSIQQCLEKAGISTFMDVTNLEIGRMKSDITDAIENCKLFVLVLTFGSLDRCKNKADMLLLEIKEAIRLKKPILLVFDEFFSFGSAPKLPKVISKILEFNGIPIVHAYRDPAMSKLTRIIKNFLSTETLEFRQSDYIVRDAKPNPLYKEELRLVDCPLFDTAHEFVGCTPAGPPKFKFNRHAFPQVSPWAELQNLRSVERDDHQKMLHVCWENGYVSKFAYVWLRDNSQTTHMSQVRKIPIADLDIDIQPLLVENRGDRVFVEWPDNIISVYESKWLALHNLDSAHIRARRNQILFNGQVQTWGRQQIEERSRWYNFETLLNDDRSLYHALLELVSNGILQIDKAPTDVGQLKRFATRIGGEYMTDHGNAFTVKSGGNALNMASTGGDMGMHSDLRSLSYAPQIKALHTIKQVRTKGGKSQFLDSFHVAEQIRQLDQEAYQILSSVPLEYVDNGRDDGQFNLTYSKPVLSLDTCGRVVECHFSNQQRSWFYDMPADQVPSVCKALQLFDSFMRKPENMLEFKSKPGQIVMFNHFRVLHGHSDESGGRQMEGCYFNLDRVKSQIRIIRDRLGIEPMSD